MTVLLSLRPEAETEIEEAYERYEEKRPGLGEEFLASLRTSLSEIEESPRRFPLVRGEMRRAVLRRFPYSLYFSVTSTKAIVFACYHGRRDPRGWQERK